MKDFFTKLKQTSKQINSKLGDDNCTLQTEGISERLIGIDRGCKLALKLC